MSWVTDVVLFSYDRDHGEAAVAKLNDWLEREGGEGRLVRVDQYGAGRKIMQINIHIAGINYLSIPEFIAQVESAGWTNPNRVSLCLQDEEDEAPHMIKLNMPKREPYVPPQGTHTGTLGYIDNVIFVTGK
jgi:hypothetical protein